MKIEHGRGKLKKDKDGGVEIYEWALYGGKGKREVISGSSNYNKLDWSVAKEG